LESTSLTSPLGRFGRPLDSGRCCAVSSCTPTPRADPRVSPPFWRPELVDLVTFAAQLWLAADETSLALGFAAEAWYVRPTSRSVVRVFPSALLLTTSIVASSSCATTQPNPDFKMATAVEYFDCSPTDPSCPARGTPHVAIDPGRFRRSLARAVFVDWKTWSKGSSLLRVRLPDGRTQNYASRWGSLPSSPPRALAAGSFETVRRRNSSPCWPQRTEPFV
jgi:hypothetical protein